jgi:hypothetical protein
MSKVTGNNSQAVNLNFELKPFKEVTNKDWVPAVNTDMINDSYIKNGNNDFPLFLKDLAISCELHAAIIQSLQLYVIGKGLTSTDMSLIEAVNRKGQDLNDTISNYVYDLIVFGYGFLELIYSKTKDKIVEVIHRDASTILLGKRDEKDNLTHAWYSKCWTDYRKVGYTPIRINMYQTSKDPSELLYTPFNYIPDLQYYTYPKYIAAARALDIDVNILKYHLANLNNGFFGGSIVTIIEPEPDDDMKLNMSRLFSTNKLGARNAGNNTILYVPNPESAPKIEQHNANDIGEQFLNLSNDIRSRILSAHGITHPLLVGISTPGSLGGGNELDTAYKQYYINRIQPLIKFVERQLLKITNFNGTDRITIDHENPTIEKIIPTENGNK